MLIWYPQNQESGSTFFNQPFLFFKKGFIILFIWWNEVQIMKAYTKFVSEIKILSASLFWGLWQVALKGYRIYQVPFPWLYPSSFFSRYFFSCVWNCHSHPKGCLTLSSLILVLWPLITLCLWLHFSIFCGTTYFYNSSTLKKIFKFSKTKIISFFNPTHHLTFSKWSVFQF